MKVFFTYKPLDLSFGGGNQFVAYFSKHLISLGHTVVYKLENNNDIDLIMVIDPRLLRFNRYDTRAILEYKRQHPNVKIIHRVNECDIKRAKSINIEAKLLEVFQFADRIVFVSEWLMNYFIKKHNLFNIIYKIRVVLNGCNMNNFNPSFQKTRKVLNIPKNVKTIMDGIISRPIKIVTHHWSSNYLKGFEIYNYLDKELGKSKNRQQRDSDIPFEFTFIGNYNQEYVPKYCQILKPMSGKELGDELKKHDIYITATQSEPGAMHYTEGLSCGLPVLFRTNGGGTTEVCIKYGESFSSTYDLWIQLDKIRNNYCSYLKKIEYKWLSSDRCCQEYDYVLGEIMDVSSSN